jgi:hypothetical protein
MKNDGSSCSVFFHAGARNSNTRMLIRGENCQWQFARKPSVENYVFIREVPGSPKVSRVPPPQPSNETGSMPVFLLGWGGERKSKSWLSRIRTTTASNSWPLLPEGVLRSKRSNPSSQIRICIFFIYKRPGLQSFCVGQVKKSGISNIDIYRS